VSFKSDQESPARCVYLLYAIIKPCRRQGFFGRVTKKPEAFLGVGGAPKKLEALWGIAGVPKNQRSLGCNRGPKKVVDFLGCGYGVPGKT